MAIVDFGKWPFFENLNWVQLAGEFIEISKLLKQI